MIIKLLTRELKNCLVKYNFTLKIIKLLKLSVWLIIRIKDT